MSDESQGGQAIEVRVPAYVVTLVCPLCHKGITWERFGVKVVPGR